MKHLKPCLAIVAIGSMMTAAGCDARNDGTTTTPTTDTSTGMTSGTNTHATNTPTTQRATQPDNTASNRGDGSSYNETPLNQSQDAEHIRITADIRRAVMEDENMSMTAKNCKIITGSDGVVTLRGVVQSVAERDAIGAHAARIAGQMSVVNELEVKAS
jgi:hyperosmotically inducible periplasmic protein